VNNTPRFWGDVKRRQVLPLFDDSDPVFIQVLRRQPCIDIRGRGIVDAPMRFLDAGTIGFEYLKKRGKISFSHMAT